MKKLFKSLIAFILTASLLVPTTGYAAVLEETPTPNYEISITKTLSEVTGNNAYFNGNTYEYSLVAGEGSNAELLVFAENDNVIELAEGSEAKTEGSIKLVIVDDVLQGLQPGTHTYTLTESAIAVDGETNTSLGEKTIEVTVYRNEAENKMEAVALVKGNEGTDEKATLESETKFATHSIKVTKEVKGNNANLDQAFEFIVETTKSQENDKHTVSENTTIKNGESFTIDGLTPSDIAKVVEKEYEGYTTEYSTTVNEGISISEDTEVIVTNTNNAEIPTGVIENIAPFMVVIVAAVAFGLVYFRKREEA